MDKYILAIDQSTSGTKAILFDTKGSLVHRCTREHRQYYPKPSWVEHDAEEIWEKTLEAVQAVMAESGACQEQIEVVGITNQRETAVVWDKDTGRPVYNAVVWQCQRGVNICRELKKQGVEQSIKAKTGLILDPYFSASKVKWILDHVEGARAKAKAGKLLFGTIDTWLLWKATGGKVHATDYSNASRTMLFNINELKWDEELLELFDIPKAMMPEVRSSNEVFGYTIAGDIWGRGVPISGLMGDSQAALFGQNCFKQGMAKATYGTGSSVVMNIGSRYINSQRGIVTSLAWGLSGKVDYVFEGNIHCTGATIKWLVDDLGLIPDSRSSEAIALTVKDNGGVYMVPAFVGLGAPYWDNRAKATITGLTRGSKKGHVVRAALEAIAYQIKDVLELMIDEAGTQINELRVDGGATRNELLMQFQADMLNVPVVRSGIEELSALGSAFMAGMAVGLWNGLKEIESLRVRDKKYVSKMDPKTRDCLYSQWKDAVRRALSSY